MTRVAPVLFLAAALATVAAAPGAAQTKQPTVSPKIALAKKITLDLKRIPATEFLHHIGRKSGAKIMIDKEAFGDLAELFEVRLVEKVVAKNETVSKVLTDTLKTLDATYRVEKDVILIVPAKK